MERLEGVCRVCLADDLNTYRVVNKALEQTYDLITGDKLQRAGRPTALCCVCVSQLRRCHRLIETARDSNNVLQQWYQNHSYTDWKFSSRPLINLTKTTDLHIWEMQVKQEPTDTDYVGAFITIEIKKEVTHDDIQSDRQTSDDEQENTQKSDDERENTQWSDGEQGYTETSDDDKALTSDDETDNMSCDGTGKTKESKGFHRNILSDNVESDTAPSTLNVDKHCTLLDQAMTPSNLDFAKQIKLEKGADRNKFSSPQFTFTTSSKSSIRKNTTKTHTPAKPFACTKCKFKTALKSNLKTHLIIHTGEKPYACNKCKFKCKKSSELTIHLRTHTGEKPFSCDKCGYRCIKSNDLKRHLRTHTGEKSFGCDMCDYKSTQKNNLTRHLMTHTGQKPFACDMCQYRFTGSYDLKRHIRVSHSVKKAFDRSLQKSNLKSLLSANSIEKPFECDICDYKCLINGDMEKHLTLHTGDNSFVCNICDYACNRKDVLQKHLSTHTGEKLYSCDICDYKSSQRSNLKRHLRTHRGEKSFTCD